MKIINLNNFLASLLLTTSLTATAALADAAPDGQNDLGVVFVGGEGRANLLYGYIGTVISIDRHDLGSDGWLVKAVAGYGEYKYSKASAIDGKGHLHGKVTNAEIEIGYEWKYNQHLLSVFLGPDYQRNTTNHHDPGNLSRGTKWGGQAGFEFITDPSQFFNAEFDSSYSTANRHFHVRLRPGFKFWDRVRFGPEVSFSGSRSYNEQHVGGFVTVLMDGWSASIHGGNAWHKGFRARRNNDAYVGFSLGLMY